MAAEVKMSICETALREEHPLLKGRFGCGR